MTILSAASMAAHWTGNGGPGNRTVAWLAVALAESGWDTEAVSPANALGLYQILGSNFAGLGLPESGWDVPDINSRAAVLLSGGGMNFAPWDTAYRDINASGRYSFLAWPESGSAAFNLMGLVAARLGSGFGGGTAPPAQPGVSGTLADALNWYATATNSAAPGLIKDARKIGTRVRAYYKPGWR